jgi:hypothetical protein
LLVDAIRGIRSRRLHPERRILRALALGGNPGASECRYVQSDYSRSRPKAALALDGGHHGDATDRVGGGQSMLG